MLATHILYLLIEIVVIGGLVYRLPSSKWLRQHLGERTVDIAVAILFAYGIYAVGGTLLFIISDVI